MEADEGPGERTSPPAPPPPEGHPRPSGFDLRPGLGAAGATRERGAQRLAAPSFGFERFVQHLHWKVGWSVVKPQFERFPAQARIAQMLLRHGLTVGPDGIRAGDLRISDAALARACAVDRRIVLSTLDTIRESDELRAIFRGDQPTFLLAAAARKHGWGLIDILPADPHAAGLIAHVAIVVAEAGISIRQVIAEDPDFAPDPHLYIITETRLPEGLTERIADHASIRAVAVLS